MMRYSFILILCIAGTAHAQYNDSTHHYIAFTSSGNINITNTTRTYLLNDAFKYGIRQKHVSLNFNNTWLYGQQQHTLTNNAF